MATDTRHVRELVLEAADEGLARRAAVLIEDALRVASFASGGRMVFVRKLDLGDVDVKASSASVSLALDRRFQALASGAVHALADGADARNVVWFADEVEPLLECAARVSAGRSTGAWFWRAAIEGWSATLPRDEALALLLQRAVATQAGFVAVVRMVERWRRDGTLDAAFESLTPASVVALGFTARAADVGAIDEGQLQRLDATWTSSIAPWIRRWGAVDSRSAWLATVALVAERVVDASAPYLPVLGARVAQRLVQRAFGEPVDEPRGLRRADTGPVAARPREQTPRIDSDDGVVAEQQRGNEQAGPEATARIGHASSCAGFACVLVLLERLGVQTWLAAHPSWRDADFVPRLLARLADFVELERDDPLRTSWREPRVQAPLDPRFVAPRAFWLHLRRETGPARALSRQRPSAFANDVWTDLSGCVVLALGEEPREFEGAATPVAPRRALAREFREPELALDAWVIALRRWCRWYCGMSLRQLARRHGRVRATPTNIDVVFEPTRVDLRIRRAGLDLDAGWLPWCERALAFHYAEDAP